MEDKIRYELGNIDGISKEINVGSIISGELLGEGNIVELKDNKIFVRYQNINPIFIYDNVTGLQNITDRAGFITDRIFRYKMKDIIEYEIDIKCFNFKYLGDIIFYDFPLLSLYEGLYSKYLAYWVDCDDECNRYLFISISDDLLNRYYEKEISFRQIMKTITSVLVADYGFNGEVKFGKAGVHILDESYFPTEDSYFDEDICVKVEV